ASGVWCPSCTAPEPTRIRVVAAAMAAMSTAGEAAATPGEKWCSATQYRRYPASSACRARSSELRSACAWVDPSTTGARSRIDNGAGWSGTGGLLSSGFPRGGRPGRRQAHVLAKRGPRRVVRPEHAAFLQQRHHLLHEGVQTRRDQVRHEDEPVAHVVMDVADHLLGDRRGCPDEVLPPGDLDDQVADGQLLVVRDRPPL